MQCTQRDANFKTEWKRPELVSITEHVEVELEVSEQYIYYVSHKINDEKYITNVKEQFNALKRQRNPQTLKSMPVQLNVSKQATNFTQTASVLGQYDTSTAELDQILNQNLHNTGNFQVQIAQQPQIANIGPFIQPQPHQIPPDNAILVPPVAKSGFKCGCGLTFAPSEMRNHSLICYSYAWTRCDLCSTIYQDMQSKYNHDVQIHSLQYAQQQQQHLVCQYCSTVCSGHSKLEQHKEQCAEYAKLKCTFCNEQQQSAEQLQQHINSVHDLQLTMQIRKCDLCEGSFFTRQDMLNHRQICAQRRTDVVQAECSQVFTGSAGCETGCRVEGVGGGLGETDAEKEGQRMGSVEGQSGM